MKRFSVFSFKGLLLGAIAAVCLWGTVAHADTTIPVGSGPYYAASVGTKLYVNNRGDNTVSVVDTITDTVTATIPVGTEPWYSIAVGPKVYVGSTNSISVIDSANDTVIKTFSIAGQVHYFTAVGEKLYASDEAANKMYVIDTKTDTITTTISFPAIIRISALVGTKLYVLNPSANSHYIFVIDTVTDTLVNTITLSLGNSGQGITLIGTKLYIPNYTGNDVTVLDTLTDTVVATIPNLLGNHYYGVAVGTKFYLAVNDTNEVAVIDSVTDTVIKRIPAGPFPMTLYVLNDNIYVLNVTSHTLSVIDTNTDTIVDTVSIGQDPLAETAVGSKLYVSNSSSNTLSIFDTNTLPYLLPNLSSFSTSTSSGTYTVDQPIPLVAHFGTSLQSGSTMTVLLNTGRSVTLNSVHGNTLSGTYTIQSGDTTPDLAIQSITSASVSDGTHTRTSYTLPSSQGVLVAENSFITRNLGDSVNIKIGSFQTIQTGNNPYQIVSSGGYAYIANQGSGTVSVINQSTNTLTQTINVGSEPYGLTLANGNVYVANTGSDTVSVISTTTKAVVATIPAGIKPYYAATIGTNVYVTNGASNTVSVINSLNNTVSATIPVGSYPRGIKAHGTDLYVANYGDPNYPGGNSVSVIDSNTNTVTDTILMPPSIDGPRGVTTLGSKVYVTGFRSNNIAVIDTGTNTVTDVIAVGMGPRGILGLGTKIYVENFDEGTISIIDTNTNNVVDTVIVGSSPSGMAVAGSDIYLTSFQDNRVYILDTNTDTLKSNTSPAVTYEITGPTDGLINTQSNTFAVTPNGSYTGSITITPNGGGLSTPIVLNFSGAQHSQTFTVTPLATGDIVLSGSNNGALTNAADFELVVIGPPSQPQAPVAVAGLNGMATVDITAPDDGGSAITGYSVTSIPSGGLDEDAGSTSLTHHISGLTNGVSYTFVVNATNEIGTSSDSEASNEVTPLSDGKEITSFDIPGATVDINQSNHMITVSVADDTDVSHLTPVITHTGSSISPDTNIEVDFTNPVTYTVTAEDSSTQDYTVVVIITGRYYFSNTTNTDPTELSNYFRDSLMTVPASILPDFTTDQVSVTSGAIFDGDITFNGNATNNGTVTGNATFNELSVNYSNVNGDAIFNNTSNNQGSVGGNAIFNGTTYGAVGTITGTVTFTHDVVFTLSENNWDNDTTNWIFNGTKSWIFNDNSGNNSTIIGDATFNDTAYNSGTITGAVVFNGSSNNYNPIIGDVIFNDSSVNYGNITGDATFHTNGYDPIAPSGGTFRITTGYWEGSVSGTVYGSDSVPITNYVFDEGSSGMYADTVGDAIFRSNSYLGSGYTLTGNAAFYDNAGASGTVNGNATFYGDNTYGYATFNGTKTRIYTADVTPNRNFTPDNEGTGPWTVIADGAVVDLSYSSYDDTTVFQTLNGGSFIYPEHNITSFTIPGGATTINQTDHTIAMSVPSGTDLAHLTPTISFAGSFVSPESGVEQDFTSPVTYTVTATNSSAQDYTVTVTIDTTPPTLTTITPISTPSSDPTPSYTFSSSEAGDISYGGSCSSGTTDAIVGNNTIMLNTLADGTYTDCTITVTDAFDNASAPLTIPSFTIAGFVTPPEFPVISDIHVTPSRTSAVIIFNADETTTGSVAYGTSASYGSTVSSSPDTAYTVTLSPLLSCTTYHYQVSVTDSDENTTHSADYTFKTTGCTGSSGGSYIPSAVIPSPVTLCPAGALFSPTTGQRCTAYQTTATTPHLPSPFHFTRSLSWHMSGDDVKQLQIYLNTHGYPVAPSGVGSLNHETNYFGLATKGALVKFQKANKIVPSVGFFGLITRAYIEAH